MYNSGSALYVYAAHPLNITNVIRFYFFLLSISMKTNQKKREVEETERWKKTHKSYFVKVTLKLDDICAVGQCARQ